MTEEDWKNYLIQKILQYWSSINSDKVFEDYIYLYSVDLALRCNKNKYFLNDIPVEVVDKTKTFSKCSECICGKKKTKKEVNKFIEDVKNSITKEYYEISAN